MPDRSIERGLADHLVSALAELGGVPVDLHRVAKALGVSAIVRAPMIEDGRTTWEGDGPRIELRNDRSAERTRFTLAHEIGHILVAQDQTVARRTRDLHADDVEILCDWIAASILMPRRWIAGYAGRDQYNLSLLRLVAHRADVSLSAAAVRLAEVGNKTCILLRWQRSPTRWLVVGQGAVPGKYAGNLQATPETNTILDRLPNRRDSWRKITLRVSVDDVTLVATAHADRIGPTCLSLLTALSPS